MTTVEPTNEEQVDHVDHDGSQTGQDILRLPPSRGGRARRRRQERRRKFRRRLRVVGGVVAAIILVVAVVAYWAERGPGKSSSGPSAQAESGPTATRRNVLLVQADPDGAAASITLVTTAASGNDHVIFIPPGTMTEVPAFGLEALGSTSALGGVALLQATVENLLGIGIDSLVVLDDTQMTALVSPAGDLRVDIPDRVEQVGSDGRIDVQWEAGPTLIGADEVGTLLRLKGSANDLSRMARQQAFWEAWLAALKAKPNAIPADTLAPGLPPVLRAFVASPPVYDVLPVESVDSSGSDSVYRVRQADVDSLIKQAIPGGSSANAANRIRVQILNGTGAVGLAQRVTVKLVQAPLRARVLYTGNADRFDYAETQIVFYDRNQRAMAEKVREALGVGALVLSRRSLELVDVTVVAGRDFH